ncbi:MAG: hypothetical protein WDN03_11910 [Rhizomicrobium sp.]
MIASWDELACECAAGVAAFVGLAKLLARSCGHDDGFGRAFDGALYQEPLLLAEIVRGRGGAYLRQITLGYESGARGEDCFPVLTNAGGAVFAPRIGYFLTGCPAQDVSLAWHTATRSWDVLREGRPIGFEHVLPEELLDGLIRTTLHPHRVTESFYTDEAGSGGA